MATGKDIATRAALALGAIQIGEPLEGAEQSLIIDTWNALIDSENIDKNTLYLIKPTTFTLTANKQVYTVGPGGDFDIPRPDFINAIQLTYSQSPDYFTDLEEIEQSDYQALGSRSNVGLPSGWYNDRGETVSNLVFIPIPSQNYPILMFIPQPLNKVVEPTDDLIFPPGYERWWVTKLAIEISPYFQGTTITQALLESFREAEGRVKNLNKRPARLHTNSGLSVSMGRWTLSRSAFSGRTWSV